MPEYPLLDLAVQRPEPGHYVYLLYGADGLLLYIGSTGNLWERFGQHAGRLRQEWWGDVEFARTVIEYVSVAACQGKRCPLPGHASMLAREAALIRELEPRFNRRLGNRCRSGRHLLTPENTYSQPSGGRTCKKCRSERWANLPEEKKQQYAQAAKHAPCGVARSTPGRNRRAESAVRPAARSESPREGAEAKPGRPGQARRTTACLPGAARGPGAAECSAAGAQAAARPEGVARGVCAAPRGQSPEAGVPEPPRGQCPGKRAAAGAPCAREGARRRDLAGWGCGLLGFPLAGAAAVLVPHQPDREGEDGEDGQQLPGHVQAGEDEHPDQGGAEQPGARSHAVAAQMAVTAEVQAHLIHLPSVRRAARGRGLRARSPVKIEFEGRTWRWDEDEITVRQAEQIEAEGPWEWLYQDDASGETVTRSGRSILDWHQAINSRMPRAYRVLYWLMRAQNDEPITLDEADFAFPKFVYAYAAALGAEIDALAAAEAGPDPTQPPATPPTPAGPPPGPQPAPLPPASSPPPSSGS